MKKSHWVPVLIAGTIAVHHFEAAERFAESEGYRPYNLALGPHPEMLEPEPAIRTPVVAQVTSATLTPLSSNVASGMVWMT